LCEAQFIGRAASLRSRRAIRSITFALTASQFCASVVPLLSLSLKNKSRYKLMLQLLYAIKNLRMKKINIFFLN
jgi:hypothetical protein